MYPADKYIISNYEWYSEVVQMYKQQKLLAKTYSSHMCKTHSSANRLFHCDRKLKAPTHDKLLVEPGRFQP